MGSFLGTFEQSVRNARPVQTRHVIGGSSGQVDKHLKKKKKRIEKTKRTRSSQLS